MQYDPVRMAHDWFKSFSEKCSSLPPENTFCLLAASAADKHVREHASEIEWMLFTSTFYEVAMRLYQECHQATPPALEPFQEDRCRLAH